MLYKKVWLSKREQGLFAYYSAYKYTGWFLLGFIPVFIVREKND